jgi:hypothetical protein
MWLLYVWLLVLDGRKLRIYSCLIVSTEDFNLLIQQTESLGLYLLLDVGLIMFGLVWK